MALVPCRECQEEISTQARSCPRCGAPFPARTAWTGSGIDWKSERRIYGYPLIHIAFGRDQHGKLRVARGVLAIGQFAIGAVTFAQFGIGFLFGFGQFAFGLTTVAQFAIGVLFGLGQFSTGYVAIGQMALGVYALGQLGFGEHVWSSGKRETEAVDFFRGLADLLGWPTNSWRTP